MIKIPTGFSLENKNTVYFPKLKPEKEATTLFGPGVKPKEKEIPIKSNKSGCIKIKQLVSHSLIPEMDELI